MNRVVYDSQRGRMCPRCRRTADRCKCGQAVRPKGDGVVRIRREVRNGKTLITIAGVPLDDAELRELAKVLKKKCGTGGALKDGVIEIQGDHRELLTDEMRARGYTVKQAGG